MKKIIHIYREIMTYISIIGLIGFILSVLIQVISRSFLPKAPNWTEEASRYLFIYMVAFAGNAAVITNGYVGVDMFTDLLPHTVQKIIRLLIPVVLCIFSAYVFIVCVIGSVGLLAVTPVSMVSTALRLPMRYVYAALIFLFGFYILSFLFRIYLIVTDTEGAEV